MRGPSTGRRVARAPSASAIASPLASTARESSSRIRSSSRSSSSSGLGPGVVQLHHRQRLDEQRRPGRALVVDDPLHPALRLGADRDDVAAGANGTIGSPTTPAMSDERSIAFRRSRTRSCAVRSRFRIAASSLDAESSTSPRRRRCARSARAARGCRRGPRRSLGEVAPAPPGEALPEAAGGPQRLPDVEQLERRRGGRRGARARAARGCHARRRSRPVPGPR